MADRDVNMDGDAGSSQYKKKGRGHRDFVDMEQRYGRARFSELKPNSPAGPTASIEGWVIFVTGVHEEAQEEDLHEAFSEFGEVKNIYMNLDRQTGYVKGYALIEYRTQEEAQAAIDNMNGAEVFTQKVKVDYAFKKGDVKRGARPSARSRVQASITMDLPGAKDFAKAKWKSSTRNQRGRGRGRSQGIHQPSQVPDSDQQDDLDTQVSIDDHEDTEPEPGQVLPQSQGLDLEELLQQAQLQFEQSYYRYRSLQEVDVDIPTDSNPSQDLTINLQHLAKALASLPLEQVLGVPAGLLTSLSDKDKEALFIQQTCESHVTSLQQTSVPAAAASNTSEASGVGQTALPKHIHSPNNIQSTTNSVPPQKPPVDHQDRNAELTKPVSATQNNDSFLDELLGGTTAVTATSKTSVASTTARSTMATGTLGLSNNQSSRSQQSSSAASVSTTRPIVQSMIAAQKATSQGPSLHNDDILEQLLQMPTGTGSVSQPGMQRTPPVQPSSRPATVNPSLPSKTMWSQPTNKVTLPPSIHGNKKPPDNTTQSLEDWLGL